MTREEYKEAQREVELIERAIAQGEDTPKLDARLDYLYHTMDESGWTIDPDSGEVVPCG